MSVVWLIENLTCGKSPLFEALAGNFAVRLFASLSSFHSLAKAEKVNFPRILIFRGGKSELGKFCNDSWSPFPDAFRVLIDEKGKDPACQGPSLSEKVYTLHSEEPHFELNRFLKKLSHLLANTANVIRHSGLKLNMETLECSLESDTEPIPLSLKEAKLLRLFLQSAGKPFSRSDIMSVIWDNTKVSPRTIDCHISRLRKKLLHSPLSIEGIYGGGYVLR
ncbi:MAG: winged helix-turn-helix transcriptional regulator [Deltaproteobacteria bacterium]|nr:winged helix-turn-helix transcriptional regulator [Deltaproteobacteria bacterium]